MLTAFIPVANKEKKCVKLYTTQVTDWFCYEVHSLSGWEEKDGKERIRNYNE